MVKPGGKPFALTFRIPQKSFQIAGLGPFLTVENLLKSIVVAAELVESWRLGGVARPGMHGANAELKNPLVAPPDCDYLEIEIDLTPPQPALDAASSEVNDDIPAATWLALDGRFKAILGLEATMDTVRIQMEGLLTELEGSLRKTLTTEEKLNALRADVAHWTKAKSRVHFVLPKVKEYIHRAVWAMGAPERKRLDQLYREQIQPRVAFPQVQKVLDELESLHKDRQILSSLGVTVSQEARGISNEVQGALRTLQANAANARKKKAGGGGGKFFKTIRKAAGSD